ncbi:MAG: tetratricopeptide repeat protein [Fuerstia sp.]|nr:tetratricopeptide repeat protein [Fuerstiella sp.]
MILLLLLLVTWPAYQGFRMFRTYRFQVACDSAREQQDWRALRDVSLQWAAWDPASGRPWWHAAEAAQELEDLEDLAKCLGKVPQSDPKALMAYVEKANLEWTALNRPLEALATSEHVIRLDPRVLEIHSRVISFFAMNLQRSKMLKAIRIALAAGAEPKECYTYLILADVLTFTNGADINSRWLAASPDEVRFKIGLAVNTATELAMSEDSSRTEDVVKLNEDAMRQLNWFLDKEPNDPVLLTYLMHRAYLDGEVDRIAELLQKVDDRGVEDHMVWVYRGWYHTLNDDFAEAEEALREALRLHPLSPLAHHEYANLLRKTQHQGVAEQQHLAAYGKELRTQLQQLPTALDLTPALLLQIQSYAVACGDKQVADSIQSRLGSANSPRDEIQLR